MRFALLTATASLFVAIAFPSPVAAEYRAYWVETFNTPLGTRADIDRVIQSCEASNCNALFAQVRRRGDSWYLNSYEPLTEMEGVGEPNGDGKWTIDPLRYLVDQAHARSIEVHAFVIVGAIFSFDPAVQLPTDPRHVFNRHFWDSSQSNLFRDRRQWSTRSLPHNLTGTLHNGHRFSGNGEWYIDLGHPAAAAYTIEVFTRLVRNYQIDGLHLDRVRYPEAPIDDTTPYGVNVGYNETSVARFKARYGSSAAYYEAGELGRNGITTGDVGYPRTNDPLWNQWRRDQVTNFVRRVHLTLSAIRPRIRISAALISWGNGPSATSQFSATAPFAQVFQDWKTWAEEGLVDILVPMNYKREHLARERRQFDEWMRFTKALSEATGRHSIIGLGGFINSIEGTRAQIRRVLAPPSGANGVVVFALGGTEAGETRRNSTNARVPKNPLSYPTPNLSTPKRTNEDFFSAVRRGRDANGSTLYEPAPLPPVFARPVAPPATPWKESLGNLMGFAIGENGTPLDAAEVTIEGAGRSFTTLTDGDGFFGAIGLKPGHYRIRIDLRDEVLFASAKVRASAVVTVHPRLPALSRQTIVGPTP